MGGKANSREFPHRDPPKYVKACAWPHRKFSSLWS
jgi:hypothetical protein